MSAISPTPGRLIVFGSPVGTPPFADLGHAARSRLATGNFSDVDELHFSVLNQLQIGTMRLSGYSQGAAFAVSLAGHVRRAGGSVTNISLGDPPGLVKLWPHQLLGRFAGELPGTQDEVAATPIGAYQEAYRSQFGGQERAWHAAINIRAITALLAGHARGGLGTEIVAATAAGTAVSITVGQKSMVSSALAAAAIAQRFELVQVDLLVGRGHGWIHHLPTFLEFFLRHLAG